MNINYQDLTIRYPGHPKYDPYKIVETDILEVIVQKLEMLLLTNQTEVLGEDNYAFGANIEYYLWETNLSNINLKQKITQQISNFIPELDQIGYSLSLDIYEGDYQDMMQLNFIIQGYNVAFVFA